MVKNGLIGFGAFSKIEIYLDPDFLYCARNRSASGENRDSYQSGYTKKLLSPG